MDGTACWRDLNKFTYRFITATGPSEIFELSEQRAQLSRMTGMKAWFKTSKLKLTVTGTGIQVTQALRTRGAEASVTIIKLLESGQVKGSRWADVGNLGDIHFSTFGISGNKSHTVWIDLTDLARFGFPGKDDPQENGNLSEWINKLSL